MIVLGWALLFLGLNAMMAGDANAAALLLEGMRS
jgi:hypothetical protein